MFCLSFMVFCVGITLWLIGLTIRLCLRLFQFVIHPALLRFCLPAGQEHGQAVRYSGQSSSNEFLELFDLYNQLNLNWLVVGESRHPYSGTGVLTGRFSEDVHHQVREAIDHLWRVFESLDRVDHSENLNDALDAV